MNQPVTHETLFSELMELSTNPRRRDSLNRVKKACDYLEQQGMKISLSAIERYCIDRDWGGPKAQSVQNSDVLRRYVELRKSAQTVQTRRNSSSSEPLIADETIRAYVQLLKEERDQATAARERVEAGLRSIPGIPVDELIRSGFGGKLALPSGVDKTPQLTLAAREALDKLFDPKHLANCGLQLHKERIRQAITGNVLLEKHHIAALRSLSDPSSNEPG